MSIQTARLELIPATAPMLHAELRSPADLQALLGIAVPASWPPELVDDAVLRAVLEGLEARAEPAIWWYYYFVRKATPAMPAMLIGAGGYKGAPKDGIVEIGYSIQPEYRRQGYALEAAQGLVEHAFAQPEVHRVVAHTLAEPNASTRLLEKIGFRFDGEVVDPDDGPVWRWARDTAAA